MAAAVLTVTHPLPVAEAAFTSAGAASSGVATHTLSTPVLNCSPGGVLVTAVTLTWPQVASASTADPYGPASTYRADGYQIHRATGGGGFTLLTSPGRTAVTYPDSPGGLLTTYRYKIRTKKEGWFSPFSNEVTANVTSALGIGSITCHD